MKKSEFKKMIKPIVKECIKEALFEEGILSGLIKEVAQGMNFVTEQKDYSIKETLHQVSETDLQEKQKLNNNKLKEVKERMLKAVGADSYGGVDIFEGITEGIPDAPQGMAATNPLANVSPNDPGVDLSKFMGAGAKEKMKKLTEGKRK